MIPTDPAIRQLAEDLAKAVEAERAVNRTVDSPALIRIFEAALLSLAQSIREDDAPYMQHLRNCKQGRLITPTACPQCGEEMRYVRDTGGYLNADQFDAVKAGDYFCKRHEEVVYAWESKLPKHDCTCGLAAIRAGQEKR